MATELRVSRCGFVVIKLLVDDNICLLLRRNPKWKDFNLVGGHEKDRDQGDLARTALRELWEEVPSVRTMSNISLEPLGGEAKYGPVFSRSGGAPTLYLVRYFLLRIAGEPAHLLDNLGPRTRNVLVTQSDLLQNSSGRISGLAMFLNEFLPGGIQGISLSSPINVRSSGRWSRPLGQLEFSSLNMAR